MAELIEQQFKLVAIGGGGGASEVILGAHKYFSQSTVIIGVTDTGRSTGVARDLGRMPAPGDIRNSFAKLAKEPHSDMAHLLNYRFTSSAIREFEGMAIGNLMLAGLFQLHNDFGKAVEALSVAIPTIARIYPVSTENVHVCAELADRTIRRAEHQVRGLNKPEIKKLFLDKEDAKAYPPTIQAILEADIVVIGPGSFFTTIMANLLFRDIKVALKKTKAKVIFVCNSTTQPGQTEGFCVHDHCQRIVEHLGEGTIDTIVINKTTHLDINVVQHYASQGLSLLHPSEEEINIIKGLVPEVIVSDLVQQTQEHKNEWNKLDTIKYDKELLGSLLFSLAH